MTEERQCRLWNAACQRTNHLRLIIQDTHHPHNVAACLRSAEAFGVLNVDIVNMKEKFKHSTAARGVVDWLQIRQFRDVEACAADLKSQGFHLAAAIPLAGACELKNVPIERPIAVVFGNEHEGVHQAWEPHIDTFFTIPMYGLVESLNISVSCALSLYDLSSRCRATLGEQFLLNDAELSALLTSWV